MRYVIKMLYKRTTLQQDFEHIKINECQTIIFKHVMQQFLSQYYSLISFPILYVYNILHPGS